MATVKTPTKANEPQKAGAGPSVSVPESASLTTSPDPALRNPRDVSLALGYAVLALVVASFLVSVCSYVKVRQVARISVRQDARIPDVLKKMTAHPEAERYAGMKPAA